MIGEITFKKGALVGKLTCTLVERNQNKWVYAFVLLDSNRRWLVSESWKLNQRKKAIADLESIGWQVV